MGTGEDRDDYDDPVIDAAPIVDTTPTGHEGRIRTYLGHSPAGHDDVRLLTLSPSMRDAAADDAFLSVASQWRNAGGHPNVVSVHEIGREPRPWLVTDQPLGERLASIQPTLSIRDAGSVMRDTAEALRIGTLYNAVHLTVSPTCVWIQQGRNSPHVTLDEWGIRYAVHRATGSASKNKYLAPELLAGEPGDERADVYGLGLVTYFILTGESPFESISKDPPVDGLPASVPPPSQVNPDVPAGVDDVVDRALALDPENRQTSAYEFKQAISDVLPAVQNDQRPRDTNAETKAAPEEKATETNFASGGSNLTDVDEIGQARAEHLQAAGFKSLADLSQATTESLERVDTIPSNLANKLPDDPTVTDAVSNQSIPDEPETGEITHERVPYAIPGLLLVVGTVCWWGGMFVGVFLFEEGTSAYQNSIQLVTYTWFVMPVAFYFDYRKIQERTEWAPSFWLYVVGMLSIVGTGVTGLVYLKRRSQAE